MFYNMFLNPRVGFAVEIFCARIFCTPMRLIVQ